MCTLSWNSHFSFVRTHIKRGICETKCRCCSTAYEREKRLLRSQKMALYTLKLSDFTVWRHTLRKNWVNCAVLTGNNAGLRTVLSSRLSHRELRSSLRKSHSFLSLPADTTMASSQAHPFLAIHSADGHRMIHSFSNNTSYSTFYSFFSSFQITLWPMWPANSKRQPCFYLP